MNDAWICNMSNIIENIHHLYYAQMFVYIACMYGLQETLHAANENKWFMFL